MQPSAEPGKQDQLLFNNKRMKTEAEDEMGAYVVVGEEEVLDEVVEGAEAEELIEEAILGEAPGQMGVVDRSVGGGIVHGDSSSDAKRKARLKHMMQILHEKVECLADDETMELVETGLSQVVEQLKTSSSNVQHTTPRRSGRIPKPISQHFS